jgi:DNA (cytosine-5)-methyltransferase 1
MKRVTRKPTAVDLFCGAGGLSLGLRRAGFRVVIGVELDEDASDTYLANHKEGIVLQGDVREITGADILGAAGVDSIDFVAGCPPCQGFSKLTDKYRRTDARNDLVLEMARLIEELQPRAIMMENVPGLATRGRVMLDEFKQRLRRAGYVVTSDVLQLANYGIPQSRRRLVLLAGQGFTIDLPPASHARQVKSDSKEKPWRTLRDALRNLGSPITLSKALRTGGPRKHGWHVVRDLDPISIERFRALSAGNNRSVLPQHLRPQCHKGKGDGFRNAYGRMRWSQTPPTITSGCTTPCKGRFGHPTRHNTISVREAALIQSFPKSFLFETDSMESACRLIGNALPPAFARRAARRCLVAMKGHNAG